MSESAKELSRLLRESKLKISDLNAQSREEGVRKEDYEKRLIATMDIVGTTTIKNEYGTFGKQEAIMPIPKDWELIHDYVKQNDAFFLLYKQISAVAYRELLEAGEEIPGVEQYNRITISVRKPG